MRSLKYIILSGIFALGLSSCTNWLNVNTDPDNPNNESAGVSNRLPWLEHFYMYTAGVSNMRASCIAGVYYSNNGNNNALSVTWAGPSGCATTPYQTWFIEVAPNLGDLYSTAQKEGAYDYMAAADVINAMGFMEMLDLYGEIPYTQALNPSEYPSPAYDDGKTIYNGCIAKLNEAISLLGMAQKTGATSFASGDMWNQGDVNKWIKLCYGLKARYLLKLSKKTGTFNADSILYCLSKGPQSNADNTIGTCYNSTSDVTDYFEGDPVMTNGNWDYAGYGSNQRISQYYYNLLTNMRGSGVTDPRMSKIVPAIMCDIKLNSNGAVQSYSWLRSKGVDFYGPSTRLVQGGATSITAPTYASSDQNITYTIKDATALSNFVASLSGVHACTVSGNSVTVTYQKGSMYVNSTNYIYAGDTAYVNLRSGSYLTGLGTNKTNNLDLNWYPTTDASNAGAIGSTGSFQIRPVSDQEILTYHEMCFIKAEVYMRKGDKDNALAAYKAGIQAHLDMMQAKLTAWQAANYKNPDMMPMDQSAISAYMSSDAVCQSSSDLTMSDIMLQKYVAMGCSIENWNDMRRFDYSAGDIGSFGVVHPGYDRSPLFAGQSALTGTSKTDPTYWYRRWMLPPSLELNYNKTNALAMNIHAGDVDVWQIPVWWDCATDDAYNNYIKK